MSTDNETDRLAAEARLDAELRALMTAPVDTERLMAGAERRIARWRLMRMLLPCLIAAVLAVALGPTLWRMIAGLLGQSATLGASLQVELSLSGLSEVARQLPVYVWAFVAGIGLTVATTVAER